MTRLTDLCETVSATMGWSLKLKFCKGVTAVSQHVVYNIIKCYSARFKLLM